MDELGDGVDGEIDEAEADDLVSKLTQWALSESLECRERITEPATHRVLLGIAQRTGREAWKAAALPTEYSRIGPDSFVLSQSA